MSDKWKVPQLQKLRQFFLNGAEPRRAGGHARLGRNQSAEHEPTRGHSSPASSSAEMPTAPNPFRKYLRRILAWMFAPPRWVTEWQAAIDAYNADNKRFLAQMDEDIAALKAAEAPRVERGKDAWIK